MILPAYVKEALEKLYELGFEAFVVGGAVRDFLMGVEPSDYDITTPSTPEETKKAFSSYPVFLQGEKHGTVGVIIDGEKLEITTHRRDGEYLDHRRPESVEFSRALEDDLSRRDFTVNAFAFSEKSGLVDLFSGREDLENKVIRAVGDAEARFDEDALRILRAMRFSSKLGFEIEENTKKAIFKKKELLKSVSGERVREELFKLAVGGSALGVICEYEDILLVLFDGFDKVLFSKYFENAKSCLARIALFFMSVKDTAKFSKLRVSNAEKTFFESAQKLMGMTFSSRYELKKAISCHGRDAVETVLEIRGERENLKELSDIFEKDECVFMKDMKITGRDLIEIGVPKGQRIGEVLDALFERVLADEIENDFEKLISEAKKENRF